MAIAGAHLKARFGDDAGFRVFVIASDGDLMEGVSNEASSLAGHLALDNLVVLYDDNTVTIDGHTDLAFTEDRVGRYDALGWSTSTVSDGNDVEEIDRGARRRHLQDRSAEPDRGQDGDRLRQRRRRDVACPLRRARGRAAGRHQAHPGLRPREVLRHPRGGAGPLPRGGRTRRSRGGGVVGVGRCLAERRRAAGDLVGRAGVRHRLVRAGRRPDGDPRRVRQGAGQDRAGDPAADRRVGRPDAVEQHAAARLGRAGAGHPRGPLRALRRARARHGRGRQRPRAFGPARLRRHVLQLPGLHEARRCGCPL